jgi:hypothetical protein
MEWDYQYEWHGTLVFTSWLKGFAAALWLPALVAAGCCRSLKCGSSRRSHALLLYALLAGGWAMLLFSMRGTNYNSPMWFEAASIGSFPFALAGSLVLLWVPIPATVDPRRGFEVTMSPPPS